MDERSLNLHLLRCLDALIATGNVTLAADRLGLTQPGMSNALARLRELFDDPILVRTAKGMAPTARALALLPLLRSTIDQFAMLLPGSQQFDPATSSAMIRISGSDATILGVISPVINEINRLAPAIHIDIVQLPHKRLLEFLEAGEIDLAIGMYPVLAPTLYKSDIMSDSLCCLVGKSRKHDVKTLTLERYLKADHAIINTGGGYTSALEMVIEHELAKLGRTRKVGVSAPYCALLAALVAQSDMILTMTMLGARIFSEWLPLRILPVPLKVPSVTISMVWHERARNNVALEWLRQKLREGAEAGS